MGLAGTPLAHVQWGDVAAWVGAVGTTGAFVVTIWLLLTQRRELQEAEREHREVEEDRRRDQARLVSAWVDDFHPEGVRPRSTGPDEDVPFVVGVVCRNGSDEPVYHFGVAIRSDWGRVPRRQRAQLIGVFPPGTKRVVAFRIPLPSLPEGWPMPTPPIEIQFVDARGRHWSRTDEGELLDLQGRDMRPMMDFDRAKDGIRDASSDEL